MTAYFVTGTDTGVGKTTVAAGLLAAARARGLRAGALKPAESGCVRTRDGLIPADAARLREAAGGTQGLDEVCLYRLEAPLAPGVAAAQEGVAISRRAMVEAARHLAEAVDLAVVEGAGGLLVPLGDGMVVDLAADLGMPAIVVGRAGLGTINHTLLSLEALAGRGVPVAGFVLCDERDDLAAGAAEDNARQIATAGGARYLGRLPRLGETSVAALGEAVEHHLRVDVLFHVER